MSLHHFDRNLQHRHRVGIGGTISPERGLCGRRLVSHKHRGLFAAERPAGLRGLGRVVRNDHGLAAARAAVGVTRLGEQDVEIGENDPVKW